MLDVFKIKYAMPQPTKIPSIDKTHLKLALEVAYRQKI
jgi:hypothetical protein